ncbi:hypothetical protein PLICRDRAFT_45477 [Plicaturopsis crispa FD-325 SS-3]|uniref:Uncharacterized protein n=1 Tax=Plicaturopsis crispa FD-325 SS-3 TaxID=944288 RepID=A0A0C9SLD4_PLICR|nr:hypothetical protein PLICRDRAFT_45477 [Plicaturopsis crispa FD-325 SS-3]
MESADSARPLRPDTDENCLDISDPSLWSTIPDELVIKIFTSGATSSLEFAHTLCFVSSWTQALAIDHLRTVALSTDDDLQKYNSFAESRRRVYKNSICEPAQKVRQFWTENLWIQHECSTVKVRDPSNILAGVVNLATSFKWLHLLVRSASSRLWHLNNLLLLDSHAFQYPDDVLKDIPLSRLHVVPHQTVRLVSHLNLLCSPPNHDPDHDSKCCMRTHLAIPFSTPLLRQRTLSLHHKLKQLVIVFYHHELAEVRTEEWFTKIRARDGHIYFATAEVENIQKRWEEEIRGGESIWRRAVRETHSWQEDHMGQIRDVWHSFNAPHGYFESAFLEAERAVLASLL